MRAALAPLALLLAGCVVPAATPALPQLGRAEVTSLEVSSACVERREAFAVLVGVVNREPRNGTVDVEVHALQEGRLGVLRLTVPAEGEAAGALEVALPNAGLWRVYALGPPVLAPEVTVRVVDPFAGARC